MEKECFAFVTLSSKEIDENVRVVISEYDLVKKLFWATVLSLDEALDNANSKHWATIEECFKYCIAL